MPRPKGLPKTGGRTAGTTNKDIKPIREKFDQLMASYTVEDMVKDLKAIKEPAERLRIITGLSEFIIPKLQRAEIKQETTVRHKQVIKIGKETIEV